MSASPLGQTIGDLERLASRARWLLLSRRAAGLLAGAVAAAMVAIVLDWIFRFPAPFRALVLAFGLAALVSAAVRLLGPAFRFRPTPTQMALRIERGSAALRGRLASGVEFAMAGTDRESALAARSVADLRDRLDGESIGSWLAPRRSLAELGLAASVVVVAAALALAFPTYSHVGAIRLFAPFAHATWPARTAVESLLGGRTHHPRGQPLLLAARLTKGDRPTERVVADVRATREDGAVETSELVLTRQADGRYERVFEGSDDTESLEITFRSVDAESDAQRIEFVPAPAVAASRLHVEAPEYARGTVEAREVDMGDGTDSRAALRDPVMIGSAATLELTLNKPIVEPALDAGWRERVLGVTNGARSLEPPELSIDPDDARRWTLRWTVTEPREIALRLVDEYGITAEEPIRFRIDAAEDRKPTATILEPATDESVLATAVVPIVAEARDDVGLARAGIVGHSRRGSGDSPRATADESARPDDDGATVAPDIDTLGPVEGTGVRLTEEIALASLKLAPGDSLTLRALAEDRYSLDGVAHDAVASPSRTLRIISEAELGRQLRGQLASIRRGAIRLDAQQGELAAAVANGRMDAALERGQAQVSERLRDAGESLEELTRRSARSQLDDPELSATLAQAEDLLRAAAKQSAQASAALERRRDGIDAERAGAEARDAQDEVRRELEDLIKLLDRDEDAWALGREIERLREELTNLARRGEEVGRHTVGQRASELNPEDRAELERLADRHEEAARAAEALIDELRRRAEGLSRSDRSRADAMREAARVGEERRVAQQMEDAGKAVAENRMQDARASQEGAAQALDAMRRGLDDVRRARAEELKRALESLAQSIERLVRQTEGEIIEASRLIDLAGSVGNDADRASVFGEAVSERGRAVAKLATNTQAVAAEARAAGSEAARIGRILDRAADNCGTAAGLVRAKPAQLEPARTAEERALALLKEALEAAQATRDQIERREDEAKRRELLAQYRKVAAQQAGILDATVKARPADPAAPLDRRTLIESRRLSIGQGEVGRDMDRIVEENEDVRTSEVFRAAHALIAEWASQASEALADGKLDESTEGLQALALRGIEDLIDSVTESEPDRDPFQEGGESGAGGQAGGGGQGGQSQGVLPPIAELRLLRGMQAQVLERTRAAEREIAAGNDPGRAQAETASLGALQSRLSQMAEEVAKKAERPALPEGGVPGTGGDEGRPAEGGPAPAGPTAGYRPRVRRRSRSGGAPRRGGDVENLARRGSPGGLARRPKSGSGMGRDEGGVDVPCMEGALS